MHERLPPVIDAPALTRRHAVVSRATVLARLPFDQDLAPGSGALDSRTASIVATATGIYVASVLLAIGFHRHLFGDASWYLVRVLSEHQVTNFYSDFSREFFRTRWFAFHVTQWPLLWASELGVARLDVLSWVFGLSYFAPRAISLLMCWLWLKDKRLFLFPLASLFAASINAELYIVSETHFFISLVWPLLILLMCADLTPAPRRVGLVLLAIPSLLAYEAMAFFGPLLVLAAGLRARAQWKQTSQRVLLLLLAAYFALASLFAVLAIVWPRDPLNRGTFVSGIPVALDRGQLGIVASIWLTLTIPVVVWLWPRYRRLIAALLAAPVLLAAVYVGRTLVYPETVDFETHMYARAMAVFGALPLCLMFLAQPIVPAWRRQALIPCVRAVAALGILQCLWSVTATVLWANMVAALRLELSRTAGVIPYESTVLATRSFRGLPMAQLHLVWPLLPMSLVLGGSPNVTSVVFAEDYPFAPFDPRSPQQLPDLSRVGLRYDGLKAAIAGRVELDFRPGGNGAVFLGEGWSPEADIWAHWSDATKATVRLWKPRGLERGGELQMRLGAFVVPPHPRQRVTVSMNGWSLGALELTEPQIVDGPALIRLPVPAGMVTPDGRELLLQFDLPDAQSPRSFRLSEDARQLGIALVELRLVPQ